MHSQKRSRANYENDGPPSHAPYAIYGTPLPAYDPQVRDDGSFVPVWQQEVTDERGRKRLHGAFTGGWSAGYFNTVGSKEGWTPSTFVSSRTNRVKPAQQQQQRAEDYMDEEDLAEQAESQTLTTAGDFAGLGTAAGDGSGKAMFSDLFRATGETMGVKLLQRMGWRQGQGIGPKQKRRAAGDKTGEEHEFAPQNSAMISFARKLDRKGLGYAGEANLASDQAAGERDEEDEDENADARILTAGRSKIVVKSKPARKAAFGIGVLNDTGSDDEDPYSIGPRVKYNRAIGESRPIRVKRNTVRPTQSITQKLAQRSMNVMAAVRKCHDGKLPLAGFELAANSAFVLQENRHPPPEVPAEWQPGTNKQNHDQASAYRSTADAAKASTMDPRARADALGEKQLPGKSVFDFLTPATRNKLASASGRPDLPQARGERPEGIEGNSSSLLDRIPSIDKETARSALQRAAAGWMPYAEDESKRARYKSYLSLQAGLIGTFPERPSGFSTDEWVKEMREFAQAAEVFKPISGLMATRFTSSTAAPKLASDRVDATSDQTLKPSDPAEEAAKAGMFGPLTRTRTLFQPTRLLCKRFGVQAPSNTAPADHADDRAHDSVLVNSSAINQMMRHASFKPTAAVGTESGTSYALVNASVNEALEGPRPDEQTLKSIFED